MIWPNKPFYVVSCFERATHLDLGAWEFSVGIDINLARRAFNEEMSQKTYDRFKELGNSSVKDIGLASNDSAIYPPYTFVRNEKGNQTHLLESLTVPGNATQLGTDWYSVKNLKREDSFKELFEYHPHNIDSLHQASCLLSLWIKWADMVYASFKDKDEE